MKATLSFARFSSHCFVARRREGHARRVRATASKQVRNMMRRIAVQAKRRQAWRDDLCVVRVLIGDGIDPVPPITRAEYAIRPGTPNPPSARPIHGAEDFAAHTPISRRSSPAAAVAYPKNAAARPERRRSPASAVPHKTSNNLPNAAVPLEAVLWAHKINAHDQA